MIQSGWWFQIFLNFHPSLGKWSNLTNTVFLNHQLAIDWGSKTHGRKKICLEFEVRGKKILINLNCSTVPWVPCSKIPQLKSTKDILVFKYPKKCLETPLGLGFCSAYVYSFAFPPWVVWTISSNSDGPQDAIYQTQDEHSKGPGWGRTWKMYAQTQDSIDRYWYSFQWKLFFSKRKRHMTHADDWAKDWVVVDVQPLMFRDPIHPASPYRPRCFPPGIHAVSTRRPPRVNP